MDFLRETAGKFRNLSFREDWTLTPETMYMAGQCDAIVQSLLYLPISPETRAEMLRVSLVKGAQATTAIEGNTLSEKEVDDIRKGEADIPPSREYQAREVSNVLEALNGIRRDVLEGHMFPPITAELVKTFHQTIAKDLGEVFRAVPGQYRPHEVTVGTYRPPDHRAVPALMDRMCAWLQEQFGFLRESKPSFLQTVVEAVVAHVYLVWIHPFGDGNGRTARLLEFFILLRGGFPDICSHILSNHYNATRPEYYRHLEEAGKTCDLSRFIQYAVTGLRDGLEKFMHAAQEEQIRYCWDAHVSETLGRGKMAGGMRGRLMDFMRILGPFGEFSVATLADTHPRASLLYAQLSDSTMARDLQLLVSKRLLAKTEQNTYKPVLSPLFMRLPAWHAAMRRKG